MEWLTPRGLMMFGWAWIFLGFLSGACIGLFFHRPEWLGGYGAFRRRMVRLGHIALVGLGLLCIALSLSLDPLALRGNWRAAAQGGLILGAVAMPLCCFLSGWREPLRFLFPVPVVLLLIAGASVLGGAVFG